MTPSQLQNRRRALHLSQNQLAEVLGVSASTVAHWEQGVQAIPAYLDLALQTLEGEAMSDSSPVITGVLRTNTAGFDPGVFRRERVQLGVSLREMEQRTGLRPAVVSAIERGDEPVSDQTAEILVAALNVKNCG